MVTIKSLESKYRHILLVRHTSAIRAINQNATVATQDKIIFQQTCDRLAIRLLHFGSAIRIEEGGLNAVLGYPLELRIHDVFDNLDTYLKTLADQLAILSLYVRRPRS
jgi:hypothetical protein